MSTRVVKPDFDVSKLDFVSPQLAAALSHPTRVRTMSILCARPASPRQIAELMGEPLNNVTYHVKQLCDLGCIELDHTEPRAGGRVIEHFYRTTRRAYFDDDAWEMLSEKERLGVVWAVLRMMSEDVTDAMAGGTFFTESDQHISRSPMVVDEEGWSEIAEVLNRATTELFDIENRVRERRTDENPPDIHAKVEILQFRSPRLV